MSNHGKYKTATAHHHTELWNRQSQRGYVTGERRESEKGGEHIPAGVRRISAIRGACLKVSSQLQELLILQDAFYDSHKLIINAHG